MSLLALLPEVVLARCMTFCSPSTKGQMSQTYTEMNTDSRTLAQRLLAWTRSANEMRGQWIRERDMRRAHSELQFQLFIANENEVEERAHGIRGTAARAQAAHMAALAEALNADSDEPDEEDEYSDEDSVEAEEEMYSHYHF